jgi:catechol 2,3-dioxygenase-like lactoylglutathione lyase family enzyme
MTTRIAAIELNVADPARLADFYCRTLGMIRSERDGHVAVGYGADGAVLLLKQSNSSDPYRHERSDRYWKIGVTMPDLDCAHAVLAAQGVSASAPHQFRDVGYLSHLEDPEGHIIELLQHTFEGVPKTVTGDPERPLGGGAKIGLVTLRSTDIEADLAQCEEEFGLRYLVREQLPELGFDLYFLGIRNESAPDPNPDALINRPWIYQRPYTVLEFQHIRNGVDVQWPMPTQKGYTCIKMDGRGSSDRGFV